MPGALTAPVLIGLEEPVPPVGPAIDPPVTGATVVVLEGPEGDDAGSDGRR